MTIHLTEHFNKEENDEQIYLNLDLLVEKRELASRRVAAYQQRITRYYNQNIRVRQFKVSDWVLKKVNQDTKDLSQGVNGPNWEGPYRVLRVSGQEPTSNGREVKRSWNVEQLKMYFQ